MAGPSLPARADQKLDGGLFNGGIYFRQQISGVWQKRLGQLNTVQMSINPGQGELIARPFSLEALTSQNANEYLRPGKPEIELGTDDLSAETLALSMKGTVSAVSESGSGVTDESITSVQGGWIELANRNLSESGIVVTSDPSGTTYTAGDDYIVDTVAGMVYFPSDGAIPDDTALLIDYTCFDVTGEKVAGNAIDEIILNVVFHGINVANQRRVKITIPECKVEPTEQANFVSAEFISSIFSGPISTPTDGSNAYEVEYLDYATS